VIPKRWSGYWSLLYLSDGYVPTYKATYKKADSAFDATGTAAAFLAD
jgi:hypothetical protein